MSEACALCGGPVNPFDKSTWKEVTGWVGGPRKDSMRLREDTKRHAHESCVLKASGGQDPKNQPSLEDEPERDTAPGYLDRLEVMDLLDEN